jgi:hypothetical protein
MDEIDWLLSDALATNPEQNIPVICCLYTGIDFPPWCTPMARVPAPLMGGTLDHRFRQVVNDAAAKNPAIHDGAVMLGRVSPIAEYRISGWSYRLYPEPFGEAEPNRGSAFNSCLAMSIVTRVDRLYLLSEGQLIRFQSGRYHRLMEAHRTCAYPSLSNSPQIERPVQ